QTDFRCDRCFARSEAELRQTTVQWHLATLETATYATARTRVLTFVTTTTGFAEARPDTTTQALTRLLRAFGRSQRISTQLLLLNFNHEVNRVDHTANSRSILALNGMTNTTQTQAKQRCLVFRQTTDCTAGLSDFNSLCHGQLPQNFFNGFTTLGSDHF